MRNLYSRRRRTVEKTESVGGLGPRLRWEARLIRSSERAIVVPVRPIPALQWTRARSETGLFSS
jgi:hypothetical protein